MDRIQLAKELAKIAESLVTEVENKATSADEVMPDASPAEGVEGTPEEIKGQKVAKIVAGLHEARRLVAMQLKGAGPATLTEVPDISMMQLRKALKDIADIQVQTKMIIKPIQSQYDEVTRLKALEKEKTDEIADAIEHVREKQKYILETEDAILTFTAFLQSKTPGVEQMRMLPDDPGLKKNQKAGELFRRIAERLGQEVADKVSEIYEETKKDITHITDAIRGLKILAKAGDAGESATKKAGLSDAIIGLKEWFSGKADSLGMRIMNFAGDIGKWVRGFAVRTGLVKKDAQDIVKMLADGQKELEALVG